MRVTIQRHDHELLIPIPERVAAAATLYEGIVVDVRVEGNRLVLIPVDADAFTLEELLAQITDDNIHAAVDYGPLVGRESL